MFNSYIVILITIFSIVVDVVNACGGEGDGSTIQQQRSLLHYRVRICFLIQFHIKF